MRRACVTHQPMTDPDRTPTIPRLRTRLVAIGTREDYHQWGARVALTSSHAAWSETLAEVVVDLRRRQFDAIFIPRDAIAAHGLLHLAEPVAAVVASPRVWSTLSRERYPCASLLGPDGDLELALNWALSRAARWRAAGG